MKDYSNMICSGKMKNLFLFAFSIFLFSLIKRTNGQEELKCHPSCKTCQSNNFQEDDCTSCNFRNGGYILQPVKKDPRKVGKCIRSEECKYFEQYIFDQIEGYEPDEEIPCKSINDCRIYFNQYMEQYELDHEHPEDPINLYCVDCDETCLTCRGEGPNKCKFCNQTENKILNSTNASLVKEIWNMEEEDLKEIFKNRQIPVGNCVEKCPDHEYSLKSNREDGFLYGSYCLPCDDECLTCEADGSNCTSCNSTSENKYLQERSDLNFTDLNRAYHNSRSVCQPHCMQGYYPDENNICQPCNETCSACEGGKAEDCTYCNKEERILQFNEGVNFSKSSYTGKCINKTERPENHSKINYKVALYSADGKNYEVEEFDAYLPCDINCKECGIRTWNNEYYCEECKPGFNWTETMNETGKCTCLPGCKEGSCEDETGCTECEEEKYYRKDNICHNCSLNCKKCNESSCEECYAPFIKNEDGLCDCNKTSCAECVYTDNEVENNTGLGCVRCIEGYFLEKHTCQQCEENCTDCTGIGECQKCIKNYVLEDGKCVPPEKEGCKEGNLTNIACTECNIGYYLDGNVCRKCPFYCEECESENKCTICKNDKNETVFEAINGECVCKAPCEQCDYELGCLKCTIKDYYLKDGVCKNCSKNCETCDNETYCHSCYDNFILTEDHTCELPDPCLHDNGTEDKGCSQCRDGYYLSNYTCIKCNASCATCESAEKCSTCKNDTIFDMKEDKCVCKEPCEVCQEGVGCQRCPSTDYFLKDGVCQNCTENCKICNNEDTCIECYENFELTSEGKCEMPDSCSNHTEDEGCSSCKEGFYLKDKQCLKCNASCATCESAEKCSTCINGDIFEFKDNQCVCKEPCVECLEGVGCQRCPPTNYFLKDRICHTCIENCKSCENGDTCIKCYDNFILDSEGKCQMPEPCANYTEDEGCSVCNNGFYLKDKQCLKCFGSCSLCDKEADNCTKCINEDIFEFKDNKCVCKEPCEECKEGIGCLRCPKKEYFLEGGICNKCPDNCETCTSTKECTSCDIGYELSNGVCKSKDPCEKYTTDKTGCSQCKERYFLKEGECYDCSNNCLNCNSAQDCTKCEDGFYVYEHACKECPANAVCTDNKVPNSCINPDAYYFYDGQCRSCDKTSCDTCQDAKGCVKCRDKFFLDNTVTLGGTCRPCQTNCITCDEGFACRKCESGYYLENNQCLNCPEHCDSCINGESCEICSDNYVKNQYKGVIGTTQGIHEWEINNDCVSCPTECKLCTDNFCQACVKGYELYDHKCRRIVEDDDDDDKKVKKILLGTLIPMGIILIAFIVLLILFFKKNQAAGGGDTNSYNPSQFKSSTTA